MFTSDFFIKQFIDELANLSYFEIGKSGPLSGPRYQSPKILSAIEKCKNDGGKIIAANLLTSSELIIFTFPQSLLKLLTGGRIIDYIFVPIVINQCFINSFICD